MKTTRRWNRSSGITLVEVLFSIGIVAIGVFGIMAMLMLAGLRAKESVEANQAAALGRQALAEVPVRGWQRDDLVVLSTPVGPALLRDVKRAAPALFQQVFPDGRLSYCIDPLLVANSTGLNFNSPQSRFPYGGQGWVRALTMPRVTVARTIRSTLTISAPLAREFTSLKNPLSLDLPDDRTLLPVQNYDRSTSTILRRSYDSPFSWFATVTPGIDRATIDRRVYNTYVLSAVVVRQRVPYYQTPAPQNQLVNAERQVQVSAFNGTGLRGGTIQIAVPGGLSSSQAAAELAVRRGQWVLLSGVYADAPRVTAHAWYRVIGVDSVQGGGSNPWYRWITIDGADWPLFDPGRAVGVPIADTRVTLVDNVVNVTSKTIKMEPVMY